MNERALLLWTATPSCTPSVNEMVALTDNVDTPVLPAVATPMGLCMTKMANASALADNNVNISAVFTMTAVLAKVTPKAVERVGNNRQRIMGQVGRKPA